MFIAERYGTIAKFGSTFSLVIADSNIARFFPR